MAKYSDIVSCNEVEELSTSELVLTFKKGVLNASEESSEIVFGRFHKTNGLNDALSIIELKEKKKELYNIACFFFCICFTTLRLKSCTRPR